MTMKTMLVTLIALTLVLAACGSANPGKPAPTVLGTEAPAMPHY
jgi:hypothetical protein